MSKAAQRMVMGGMPQKEEEILQSPMRMALQSFLQVKIAMAGIFCFVGIFVCCVILPVF